MSNAKTQCWFFKRGGRTGRVLSQTSNRVEEFLRRDFSVQPRCPLCLCGGGYAGNGHH
jgi:hypothetical protein